MSRPPFALEIAHRLIPLLEEMEIDYAILGGLAVVTWGVPRTTFDLDFAVSATEAEIVRFLNRMEVEGHVVDEIYRKGWRDSVGGMPLVKFSFKEGLRLTRIDLFPVETEFQRSAHERRVRIDLGGVWAWIVSAADLVVFKLLAYRNKDKADLDNVLTIQGIPESEYVENWVKRLGLEERFEPFRTRYRQ